MPIAQLHDGTQIHFPDGTPDEHIDATVQRHLGVGAPPAAMDPDVVTALLQAVGQHANSIAAQRATQGDSNSASQAMMQKTHIATSAGKIDAINGVAASLEKAIGAIVQPLTAIANNAVLIKGLIDAVNKLTAVTAEAGKTHADAVRAPRDIKISRDMDGAPEGARTSLASVQ